MKRTILAATLALAALAACQQDPGGRCAADADCKTGQHCSNGVCLSDLRQVAVGQSCYVDKDCVAWASCVQNQCLLEPGACDTTADCQPWQACNAGHGCEMVAGGCASEPDCAGWQDCNTSTWRCETAPGFCADEAGCAAWQDCGIDHRCATAAGYCGGDVECGTWQVCDLGSHRCATRSGYCASDGECDPWEACGTDHVCALAPNGCADASGCAAWQDCVSYRCETGAAFCAAEADCAAWQDCDLGSHACVTAGGFCADGSGCETWQQCPAATHVCETAPGFCASDADCPVSGASCGAGHVCATPPFDPSAVYLHGTLQEGSCEYDAFTALDRPTRPFVGFDCDATAGMISPSGDYVYEADAYILARFVPDAFEWSDFWHKWMLPSNPKANDIPVPLVGCEGVSWYSWIVKAVTGEIFHACSETWLDEAGAAVFVEPPYTTLRAWNGADVKLLTDDSRNQFVVVDSSGASHAVTAIDTTNASYRTYRSNGSGFRVMVYDEAALVDTLWSIDEAGAATLEGTYPPLPGALVTNGSWALDSSGALYEFASTYTSFDTVVVRRTVSPPSSDIVYDETLGTNDWTTASWYVRIHISELVTGP